MTDRPTILVVEDDPDIRELLAELLEDEGYDVHIAADGEAAIDELEHWEPSVMLLDLMLPRISGWEILRRLRTGDIGHPPNAIIVLSASGAAANEATRSPHVRGMLRKPFKVDQLLETVEDATHAG
ncbi:MAG: response regulator transcription factor [Myxococcaceae bacterium]